MLYVISINGTMIAARECFLVNLSADKAEELLEDHGDLYRGSYARAYGFKLVTALDPEIVDALGDTIQ